MYRRTDEQGIIQSTSIAWNVLSFLS